MHKRLMLSLVVLTASSMALVGCAATVSDGSGPGDAGRADGIVTILGTASHSEAEILQQSWADWEEANNIEIRYEASSEFGTQINLRAQGGRAPDLAIFPEPALLLDLASRDLIQPAPDVVMANVKQYWSHDWANYAMANEILYGAPLTANVNGFIWYSPKQFAAKEWTVPVTWNGLLNLTAQMQEATGKPPWCAGFDSKDSAGWPGADWVEDLVLRQAGADTYDRWLTNEVKFSDPQIMDAFDSVGAILRNPDYVNAGFVEVEQQVDPKAEAEAEADADADAEAEPEVVLDFSGVKSINETANGDVAKAMADRTCSLTHQASSFEGLLTDPDIGNTSVGPDKAIWAFVTPSLAAGGNSVTGSGEYVGAFSNDADTVKVQQYLSSPEWANSRAVLGGMISANNGLDPANASSPLLEESVKLLQSPKTTFRFDGSALMPRAVGSGSFPARMLDWVNGKSVEKILASLDESWPSH